MKLLSRHTMTLLSRRAEPIIPGCFATNKQEAEKIRNGPHEDNCDHGHGSPVQNLGCSSVENASVEENNA